MKTDKEARLKGEDEMKVRVIDEKCLKAAEEARIKLEGVDCCKRRRGKCRRKISLKVEE